MNGFKKGDRVKIKSTASRFAGCSGTYVDEDFGNALIDIDSFPVQRQYKGYTIPFNQIEKETWEHFKAGEEG